MITRGKAGIVYVAVNRLSRKAYVGVTCQDLGCRVAEHLQKAKLGYSSHFYRAIRKYGFHSFDWAILCAVPASFTGLADSEKAWIAYLGSTAPTGYNLTLGGEGTAGLFKKSEKWRRAVTSDEVRLKQSIRAEKWRASMTPEQKAAHQAKITAAKKGKVYPHMLGSSNPAKTLLARVNISEGLRRSWQDPEVRARRAAAKQRSYQK